MPALTRARSRRPAAPAAAAILLGLMAPCQAAVLGTCTIVVGASGQLKVDPLLTTLSSTIPGGQAATATVTTNATLCVAGLVDCFGVTAAPPVNFTSAPGSGGANVAFASSYKLGGNLEVPGAIRTAVINGTYPLSVNLTATKTSGVFEAGSYQAQVTVRCE